MIERSIFREEHNIFRESVRRFVEREIVPFHAEWEEAGICCQGACRGGSRTGAQVRGAPVRRVDNG